MIWDSPVLTRYISQWAAYLEAATRQPPNCDEFTLYLDFDHPYLRIRSRHGSPPNAETRLRWNDFITWLRIVDLRIPPLAQKVPTLSEFLTFGCAESGIAGIFSGPVLDHYLHVKRSLPERKCLRIRLVFQSPDLSYLPWELLRDPDSGALLSTHPRLFLVRSFSRPEERPPVVTNRLRGLILTADSRNCNLHRHADLIQRSTLPFGSNVQWEPQHLEATLPVDRKDYHIVHISAHGDTSRGFRLYLTDDGSSFIDESMLCDWIESIPSLRLLVLASCDAGLVVRHLHNLAFKLQEKKLQALILMRTKVGDASLSCFIDHFYRAFFSGVAHGDVACATGVGRAAVEQMSGRRLAEHATPLCYLTSSFSSIFELGSIQLNVDKKVRNTVNFGLKVSEEVDTLRRAGGAEVLRTTAEAAIRLVDDGVRNIHSAFHDRFFSS